MDDEREMKRGGRAKYLWAGRGCCLPLDQLVVKF